MKDQEILARLLSAALEDHRYFSNRNKEERERFTVSEFLSILRVEHLAVELVSPEQSSKTDVHFRSANFQVKEIPDPNLRRGKMYKDAYNSIKSAKSLDEVSLVSDICDISPVARMHDLVLDMACKLAASEKYEASKGDLDLLVYVTRARAGLIQAHELDLVELTGFGWRSISCVNAKQAVVLFSSTTAPEFIKERSQIIMSARD